MPLRKRKSSQFYATPVILGLEHGVVYGRTISELDCTNVPFLSMQEVQLLTEYEAQFVQEEDND